MPEPGQQRDSGAATVAPVRMAFYPFLFSLYPVLFLYLHNIRETAPTQALAAAAASLAIALVYWLFTHIISRRTDQRALLLFIFLLLFHFYGLYFAAIAFLLPRELPLLVAHALAFILPGGCWLLLSRAVRRGQRSFKPLNRILTTAVICLAAWNLAGILLHHGRAFFSQAERRAHGAPSLERGESAGPDIYCFILDEFAAIEAARALFQYDNSAFADRLRQSGFFVARASRSPFLKTELALASFLNPGDDNVRSDPFARIRRNTVASSLKQRGYRIIEFPVSPAMFMDEADERHYYSLTRVSIFYNEFYRTLCERSLLRVFADRWRRRQLDTDRCYRERVLQVFEKIPAVVKRPGPKFVYVHLYSPHEPFVFDAQGGPAAPGHLWDHADPRYYLQQYIFISAKMLETVDLILRNSQRPPLIIMQSDHGYRGSLGRKTWQRLVDDAEAQKVFNSLYLPGVDPDTIAPSLSPRNNFRLVFNLYFGKNYPLLPNF